jgi:serine/threonine-protein kinase
MDYVQGESLSRLIRAARERGERIPPRFVSAIMSGALHGLHAAHEAKNERGEPLRIVHRDISPQNVLVGSDGVARVLDFGVAKAAGRMQTTREGQLKGKLAYMAPEQIGGQVTRQTDVYAAGIVLWEALTSTRLFSGDNEGQILSKVLSGAIAPPSSVARDLPPAVDDIVLRGLARETSQRYATAREFAIALERCLGASAAGARWELGRCHSGRRRRCRRAHGDGAGRGSHDRRRFPFAGRTRGHRLADRVV